MGEQRPEQEQHGQENLHSYAIRHSTLVAVHSLLWYIYSCTILHKKEFASRTLSTGTIGRLADGYRYDALSTSSVIPSFLEENEHVHHQIAAMGQHRRWSTTTCTVLSLFSVVMWLTTARAFLIRTPQASFPLARFMTTEDSVVAVCQQKIQAALQAESVQVTGAFDDPNGSHIQIQVVSSMFEGKRPMQRQQLVYKAIWEEMQGRVHAVDSMTCKTPSELK
jgi:acid stress-induced BolA-like protein IbaG/YrbA